MFPQVFLNQLQSEYATLVNPGEMSKISLLLLAAEGHLDEREGNNQDLGHFNFQGIKESRNLAMEDFAFAGYDWVHNANTAENTELWDSKVSSFLMGSFNYNISCSISLNSVTHLADEWKALDVVYLDFRKVSDTDYHSILPEELAACGLDGCSTHWAKTQ
ncbi:hypothetical protein DUI87_07675 [Hirundo rustica rustica]|uniref:Uncharacterized protein n=1 Tax=Hirundo rustica rustica TaxID=333673 RepID=A0A3M0KQU4_HIRRU|nr:hypothetical protein DUI87_07675 [Hirundo rustica rustica]